MNLSEPTFLTTIKHVTSFFFTGFWSISSTLFAIALFEKGSMVKQGAKWMFLLAGVGALALHLNETIVAPCLFSFAMFRFLTVDVNPHRRPLQRARYRYSSVVCQWSFSVMAANVLLVYLNSTLLNL
ncbi:hypothetical protein [Vibrio mediterranei]|uniref:hypothetical protein n=1 Tax=Vibrio mediterranei TaxID=689 RepID=UPI001EFC624C|nr:hypothetical protein [Vibrio mediterranei]MCG9657652.1 hypothetical protein [Vibrio mediterranei]